MKPISVARAVLVGGVVAATLDLAFALSFAAYNGATPQRLLQTVASGWLGEAAFAGGWSTAALGFASHYALSLLWAGLFALAAKQVPALLRQALLTAIAFGIVVFFTMRLVVLPLSAFPRPVSFKPLGTVLDLLSHMFLFAWPIVAWTRRALAAPP
jgi:uncharacterized membrane protein YagU involved in acid resistance